MHNTHTYIYVLYAYQYHNIYIHIPHSIPHYPPVFATCRKVLTSSHLSGFLSEQLQNMPDHILMLQPSRLGFGTLFGLFGLPWKLTPVEPEPPPRSKTQVAS